MVGHLRLWIRAIACALAMPEQHPDAYCKSLTNHLVDGDFFLLRPYNVSMGQKSWLPQSTWFSNGCYENRSVSIKRTYMQPCSPMMVHVTFCNLSLILYTTDFMATFQLSVGCQVGCI
jgi:hypothetical protein